MSKQLLLRAAFLLAMAAVASACAKADASNLVPDGPPLAMPVPPPRVITPVEEVAVVPDPPAPDPPPAVAKPQPKPAPPRAETKADPAPVAAQPAAPPAAAPEPREVRAVPTAAAAAEDRKVRDVMGRASRDLERVDYQKLSAEARTQYEQSKSFSKEAEQALKERNYVYAMTLAEKAANLAAQLVGR
jgi:hypothetical protein